MVLQKKKPDNLDLLGHRLSWCNDNWIGIVNPAALLMCFENKVSDIVL